MRTMLLSHILLFCSLIGSPASASGTEPLEEGVNSARSLCGPRCLAFCANWLGRADCDVESVAELSECDQTGTSLAALARAAWRLGLAARPYRLELDDLLGVTSASPGIAHLKEEHFVVVWAKCDGRIIVVDPPHDPVAMSLKDFGRRWDGAILIVSQPGGQPRWPSRYAWLGTALLALSAGSLAYVVASRRRKGLPSH